MALAAFAAMPTPPTPAIPPPPKLLDRLRAAIRLRHFSRRTEEAYVGWVRRYILFHHKRHPVAMSEAEVTFLIHLAEERRVPDRTGTVGAQGCEHTQVLNRRPLGVRSPADRLRLPWRKGLAKSEADS